jgi:hypothetical protein
MANTMELISSTTVGAGGATSISLTSIPSTFTDLCFVYSVRTTANGMRGLFLTFNSNSSSYTDRYLQGSGSSTASGSNVGGGSKIYLGAIPFSANTFGSASVYVPNYTSSNFKSVSSDSVSEANFASPVFSELVAGLWSNTAAITSISLSLGGDTFSQYSSLYLYGVKNA